MNKVKIRVTLAGVPILIALSAIGNAEADRPEAGLSQGAAATLVPSLGPGSAQYSNSIVDEPGGQKSYMFFCRNSKVEGVQRDRIWRAESSGTRTGWVKATPIIENTDSPNTAAQDDLSCGPSVVNIDHVWHMYYLTANRRTPVTMEVWHAIAEDSDALHWKKMGRVEGLTRDNFGGIISSVSPIVVDGKLVFYVLGRRGHLYRVLSSDGYHFTKPELLTALPSSTGRVTYAHGIYYFAFAFDPTQARQPPTHLILSYSKDGREFTNCRDLTDIIVRKFPALHYFTWPLFDPTLGLFYFSGSPQFPQRKGWESLGSISVYADRSLNSPDLGSDCPRDKPGVAVGKG